MAVSFDRERLAPLKDTVAVVGVGETDYGADYRGAGGKAVAKGEARYDSYTLASRALKRALDDAGLKKDDIDGLCTGPTLSSERACIQRASRHPGPERSENSVLPSASPKARRHGCLVTRQVRDPLRRTSESGPSVQSRGGALHSESGLATL